MLELYRHYSISRSKCKRAVRFFSVLQYMNLGLTLVTVGGQGYGNGADSKIKSKETQILYIGTSLHHVAPIT